MDYDIVIVGGGPAGLATALFFAAAAPRLLGRLVVLERGRYPREKICAGALGARADRLLARIDVRVEVPAAPVRGLSVVTSRGACVVRQAEPIGRVVRRAEFDHALAEVARARGVRILEGTRASGLSFERDGVRLATDRGELRARVVVGADGVGSQVRRALGAPRGAWRAQGVEVDTSVVPSDRARDLLHFDLRDPTLLGYGWDFPTVVGGEPLVCRGLYELRPDEGLGLAPPPPGGPDLSARLRDRLRELGLAADAPIKRFAERGLSWSEPLARPRALLVGEAAGIDPALGEGIAQALFYGAVAGPYLARCLDRGDLAFASFPREIRRSRLGLDLGLRSWMTPWIYGRTRPLAERWIADSSALATAGMRYFAGDRVPRRALARAALDLGAAALGELLTSARRRPWW